MAPPNTFTTTVHPFPSPTSHACAYEIGPQDAKNSLVFIGGLGDGPHTVPYPRAIAKRLEEDPSLSYSVFEFRLKSSFSAFGFSRLVDDVADIAALVKYLRSIGKERVVLMGHSTGSQVNSMLWTWMRVGRAANRVRIAWSILRRHMQRHLWMGTFSRLPSMTEMRWRLRWAAARWRRV